MSSEVLVGIFIGGQARRMGGAAKGLLRAPGSTHSLSERLIRVIGQAVPDAAVVFVGRHAGYAEIGIEQIADADAVEGPRAGLLALCRTALVRHHQQVVALACDLPYVEPALLVRLVKHAPQAAAVAPRVDHRFQPFFARYRAELTQALIERDSEHPSAGLIPLLKQLHAAVLPLNAEEALQLRDWDTPADVEA